MLKHTDEIHPARFYFFCSLQQEGNPSRVIWSDRAEYFILVLKQINGICKIRNPHCASIIFCICRHIQVTLWSSSDSESPAPPRWSTCKQAFRCLQYLAAFLMHWFTGISSVWLHRWKWNIFSIIPLLQKFVQVHNHQLWWCNFGIQTYWQTNLP